MADFDYKMSGGAPENANIAPLLKRAFMFLEDGNWPSADVYAEKVLDIEPELGEAYLVKLMAELQVRSRTELRDCANSFEKNSNYQKVMRYGDVQLKEELQGAIDFILERNARAKYEDAVAAVNQASKEKGYLAAAKKLRNCGDYEDAPQRAEECLRKAEELRKKNKRRLKKGMVVACIAACVAAVIITVVGIPTGNVALNYLGGNYGPYITLFQVKDFTVPKGVTEIKDNAFAGCTSLESVTIPASVTTVGENAFTGCNALKEIVVNSEAVIDSGIIGKTEVSTITIGGGVTTIGTRAFYGCDSLTKVTILDSVTTIGSSAFSDCASLTEVTIPDGVTTIGHGAFKGCDSLTEVTIPDSVTTIGNSAFYSCNSLTEVTIPNSITTISNWAFEDCDSLTEVTIPDGVTTIGKGAFEDCDSLTEVTIPDSVTTIGNWAFDYCYDLDKIYFDGTRARWNALDVDLPYGVTVICAK